MPNELTKAEPAPLAIPMTATERLIQQAIERGLDPGQLYDILATERADARKQQYSAALAAFQPRVEPVVKATSRIVDRGGNTIDYASLADIRRHVDPILKELGLTLSYGTVDQNGQTYATVKLTHSGGHTESATLPFRAAKPPGASNDAQAIGAGCTYAWRYLTAAILGLWFVDRDTDAEPVATVVSGPLLSDEDVLAIRDAVLQAADRTDHTAEEITGRLLRKHSVVQLSQLPASCVSETIAALDRMGAK